MFKLFVTIVLAVTAITGLSACDPGSVQSQVFAASHKLLPLDNFGEILAKKK